MTWYVGSTQGAYTEKTVSTLEEVSLDGQDPDDVVRAFLATYPEAVQQPEEN